MKKEKTNQKSKKKLRVNNSYKANFESKMKYKSDRVKGLNFINKNNNQKSNSKRENDNINQFNNNELYNLMEPKSERVDNNNIMINEEGGADYKEEDMDNVNNKKMNINDLNYYSENSMVAQTKQILESFPYNNSFKKNHFDDALQILDNKIKNINNINTELYSSNALNNNNVYRDSQNEKKNKKKNYDTNNFKKTKKNMILQDNDIQNKQIKYNNGNGYELSNFNEYSGRNIEKNPIDNEENKINQQREIKIYDELEEQFENLFLRIKKRKENPKISSPKTYLNQITFPNLKRYRQKSESNLKFNPSILINNNNINLRRGIKSPEITIKYNLENKNLIKFKGLEEKVQNENTTKRKINVLLNQQNNSDLKNILCELQTTIRKLPNEKEKKDKNLLTTLPANNLSPFELINISKDSNPKVNSKMKKMKYIKGELNNQRNIENFRSKLNDVKGIINGKNKINFDIKGQKLNSLNRGGGGSIRMFSSLSPVNYFSSGLYSIEG